MNIESAEKLSNKGEELKQKGQINKAIAYYQKAIELNPNCHIYYHKLGNIFQQQGQVTNASIYYRQAISINSHHSWSYHSLGEVLTKKNQLEEAVTCYQKAIAINPDFSWSHYNLGKILQKKNQLEEAKQCYYKAIELDPQYYWAYYFLAEILTQQEQFQLAIKYYHQAIELQPDNLQGYIAIVKILIDQGQEAIEQYRQSIDNQSDLFKAYLEIGFGKVWEQKKQLAQAIECYENAIEIEPYLELPYQLIQQIHWQWRTPVTVNNFVSRQYQGDSNSHKDYQKFLIIGHPRTGSNFLVSLLHSHPQIRAFGEVFTEYDDIHWGYSGYKSKKIFDLRYSYPIKFLDDIVYRKTFPSTVVAVGFKLFYFQPKQPHQQVVRKYLQNIKGLKIIHLKRKNIFHTYISHLLAAVTDEWILMSKQKTDSEQTQAQQLTINYEDCLQTFEKIRNWEQEYTNLFSSPTQQLYELWYEELASDTAQQTKKLQAFLGVEERQLTTYTKKQPKKPIEQIVANYDELKEKFQDTCWHEFFN